MFPPPFHTLVFLCVLLISSPLTTPSCFAATANGGSTLNAGQALAAGNKLVSRNGKFALGFFRSTAAGSGITSKSTNVTTSPGWYLGIWFDKIPVFTTVWVANRESPITDLELNRTELKISADCKLVITLKNNAAGSTTESLIWSTTHTVNGTTQRITNSTCTGLLQDDGNLVLVVAGSPSTNSDVLWQSFDYPADVGLPGAKLGRNKVTGLNYQYISKKSLVDPGLGAYYGALETNGVATLRYRHHHPPVEYWSSAIPPGKLKPVLKTLLDMDPRTKGMVEISYVDNKDEQYFTYTLLDKSSFTFISLDVSGQLKLNVWSPSGQSWQTIYSIPPDPCSVYAVCGAFSICNGDKSSPSYCGCMKGFSPKSPQDWEIGDAAGGCLRNTSLDCASKKTTDEFLTLAHVTLPGDPQIIEDVNTQSDCAGACLSDCSCTAYSYDNNSRCSVWHGDLLNVKQNDGIDHDSEGVLYIRLAAEDFRIWRKNKRMAIAIVTATVASTIIFGLLILVILVLIWRYKYKGRGELLHINQGSGGGIIAFRYTDLCQATKNFSEKLGGGGFGSVFKGVLCDMTPIAVKRLDGACQGEKQFRAEVSSIGLIQHINLVKLIGFCCQGDKRLLVYEHVLNGSLDAHLFQSNSTTLNWSTRYQIAAGVARGLYYLHHSCRECIIHCDIKPQNILLDASFVPKIADFGMSVFVGRDFSRILTTFRGTLGYLAPEWLSGVAITPKIDVYSFGMVLLELISGRRNLHEVYTTNSVHTAYFPMQAINKLREGDVHSLVDPQLQGDFNLEQAEKICKLACWCIQDNESDRPTMGEVVRVLEGLQELDIPPMPRLLAAITEGSTESSI